MLQIFYPYQCCLHSSIRTVNGLQVYVRFYLCFLSFSICLPSCNLFHILLVRQTTFFGLYYNYVPPPLSFNLLLLAKLEKEYLDLRGIPINLGSAQIQPPFLPFYPFCHYGILLSNQFPCPCQPLRGRQVSLSSISTVYPPFYFLYYQQSPCYVTK